MVNVNDGRALDSAVEIGMQARLWLSRRLSRSSGSVARNKAPFEVGGYLCST